MKKGNNINLSIIDFNISVLILGNFANIIMLLGRFVSGLDGGTTLHFIHMLLSY